MNFREERSIRERRWVDEPWRTFYKLVEFGDELRNCEVEEGGINIPCGEVLPRDFRYLDGGFFDKGALDRSSSKTYLEALVEVFLKEAPCRQKQKIGQTLFLVLERVEERGRVYREVCLIALREDSDFIDFFTMGHYPKTEYPQLAENIGFELSIQPICDMIGLTF